MQAQMREALAASAQQNAFRLNVSFFSIHAPLERFRAPAAARHHTPLSARSPAAPAPVSGLASALATLLERLPHRHTRLPLVQVTRTARGARPAAARRAAPPAATVHVMHVCGGYGAHFAPSVGMGPHYRG